ncbi:MAG TPA: pyrroloquinoline quinone biosynthesis protein PqqB [Terriglobales bacterium]|nr:pyrroloquinoline quinone biosynthesis protein PqqB [Terriglobales bacterium]
MHVKVLGSAAGGAFPQWNCACRNCSSLRAGTFQGKARTQTQLAVSEDGISWFLLGASPDLRVQIEATPELHPRSGLRQSPIAGVVLTNADIDHVLGLLLLRELQPFRVYATRSIHRILREDNNMFAMLNRIPGQVQWIEIAPQQLFSLDIISGKSSGLKCLPISLSTHYPAYLPDERAAELAPGEALLGLILESSSGKRLAFMPAIPQVEDALLKQLDSTDLMFFDGTFWSDDELIQVQGSGQTARQMGHIPISSPEGSLQKLAKLRHPRKIFLHINNTNPILDESSPQRHEVLATGWQIAEDGWQIDL